MALDDHHKHFVGQITQKALIEKDGKILLVQYPNDDHVAANKWDLPGGRLHDFESALEGVKREVEEEIGAPVEIDGIMATGVNRVRDDFKLFFVIYRAYLKDPRAPLRSEAGEIGKIEWRDRGEFFTLPIIYSGYQEALKDILR
ncbi:MAG: NUDIX domain-containing protein [Patescibacteria group bacterium]|nr:NUDIX domain-containing protein [Patescibacteria group bacterium]